MIQRRTQKRWSHPTICCLVLGLKMASTRIQRKFKISLVKVERFHPFIFLRHFNSECRSPWKAMNKLLKQWKRLAKISKRVEVVLHPKFTPTGAELDRRELVQKWVTRRGMGRVYKQCVADQEPPRAIVKAFRQLHVKFASISTHRSDRGSLRPAAVRNQGKGFRQGQKRVQPMWLFVGVHVYEVRARPWIGTTCLSMCFVKPTLQHPAFTEQRDWRVNNIGARRKLWGTWPDEESSSYHVWSQKRKSEVHMLRYWPIGIRIALSPRTPAWASLRQVMRTDGSEHLAATRVER